jgi:hypothetical protein
MVAQRRENVKWLAFHSLAVVFEARGLALA